MYSFFRLKRNGKKSFIGILYGIDKMIRKTHNKYNLYKRIRNWTQGGQHRYSIKH